MIIDCVLFFREIDLLEIRLNVLAPVVDKFIIVEQDHTHAGNPKPYYYYENESRFSDFPIEFHPVQADATGSSWDRENKHRRSLKYDFDDGDTIIISDVDEIPNPDLIKKRHLGRYIQRMYYFYLNTYAYHWYSGTMVLSGRQTKEQDFQDLRMAGHRGQCNLPQVENGGWHFSTLGTEEDIRIKMKSYAHTEYSDESGINKVLSWRRNLQDIGGSYLTVVPIDDSYPKYIQENQDKYSNLIYHE